MHEPLPTPAITTLGRYEILGRIAAGGMATVYLGRLGGAGGFAREFAIKVIHPHLSDNEDFRARFLEEARLASRVRHPNAVRTIDACEAAGYRFLVLELIDGVNLRQLMLRRNRPLSPLQAAATVAQVARGLHALHSARDERGRPLAMVHRDISPHNVMIDREGRAIVIDLGLAKAEERDFTQVGTLCGKLPYMSPEQARMAPLGPGSDIFSLGTVLFELCTGTLPFGEEHDLATLTALQKCDTAAVARQLARFDIPEWLVEVILVCLQPQPDARFASAEAVCEALMEELHRQGYDETRIRSSLASLVADAMPEIGTTEALDTSSGLPQLLGIPTGRYSRATPVMPLRWGIAGVIAVGLLAFGVGQWSTTRGTLERTWNTNAGHLASDQAPRKEPPSAAVIPASPKHRSDGSAPATAALTVDVSDLTEELLEIAGSESGEGQDTHEAKSPGRHRKRPRSAPRISRLKPNPYANP